MEVLTMRIRGHLVEYDLPEAARILRIPTRELLEGVKEGRFQYFYRIKGQNYKFHDASIETNRMRL
jgi:hypothetical protein